MSFFDFIKAAELGAASVYHKILDLGVQIVHWDSDPAVAPLVSAGVGVANSMLQRAGVNEAVATVLESDVHAALKSIAAADPTVPSVGAIGALAGMAGNIVTSVDPSLSDKVYSAEGLVNMAEGLATTSIAQTSTTVAQVQPAV